MNNPNKNALSVALPQVIGLIAVTSIYDPHTLNSEKPISIMGVSFQHVDINLPHPLNLDKISTQRQKLCAFFCSI